VLEIAHGPGDRDDFGREAHVGFDLPSLEAMAEQFEVDPAAAALRALLYGEPCAVVVAKGGRAAVVCARVTG
jgi:hypothetical protein